MLIWYLLRPTRTHIRHPPSPPLPPPQRHTPIRIAHPVAGAAAAQTLFYQSDDLDDCDHNLVKGNRIATHGNECVDIKEGASGNVIEYNVCSDQLDSVSGCYQCRGDGNTFR